MRQRVLDVARDKASADGWNQVSLSAVAADAEVSRPSVYKEFGSRAGLGHALVVRETQEFLAGVADVLHPGRPDTRACLEAAIRHVLTEAHHNPLISAVVMASREGSDSLLPYLTARADPIFDAAQALLRAWLAERFPDQDEPAITGAADITVRMTISHLVLPDTDADTDTDAAVTAERLAGAVLKLLR
ncbi:TetR family transcriptional regulator [Streptomyces sp. NPDC017546]|uniref:TetR family transcriptional regulator n=1 Tax=unclassified Streptomyces TaxID=2593676 RepID=UPI002361182F|nr:TetR family transcriptional regulator [Streptomyces sp. MMBL 11-1]